MAKVYAHQALVIDDPWFQLRVRQVLVRHALLVAGQDNSTASEKRTARLILDRPQEWAQSVASAYGSKLVTSTGVTDNSLEDDEFDNVTPEIFAAYVPGEAE